MSKKIKSTYDKFVESMTLKQRKEFEKGYKEFLISEMVLAAMEQDGVSVRKLAKEAGVSPTIVQGIRSGKRGNLTVKSLLKVLHALGYKLKAEKEDSDISISLCM